MNTTYEFERGKEKGYPERCPVTGMPYFMDLEKDGEMVPTYGGPFDSYTIPQKDENGNWEWERYDHDEGAWVGWESVPDTYTEPTDDQIERINEQ